MKALGKIIKFQKKIIRSEIDVKSALKRGFFCTIAIVSVQLVFLVPENHRKKCTNH